MNLEAIQALEDETLEEVIRYLHTDFSKSIYQVSVNIKMLASQTFELNLLMVSLNEIGNLLPLLIVERNNRYQKNSKTPKTLEPTLEVGIPNHVNFLRGTSHRFVKSWEFQEEFKEEAFLANQIAIVGEKNGLSANDVQHIFPMVLRMLKSKSEWSN